MSDMTVALKKHGVVSVSVWTDGPNVVIGEKGISAVKVPIKRADELIDAIKMVVKNKRVT